MKSYILEQIANVRCPSVAGVAVGTARAMTANRASAMPME
jgi:hypothetical protein